MLALKLIGLAALLVASTAQAATEFPIELPQGQLSIVEGATLDVQPAKVVFTGIPLGQRASRTIVIRNDGPELEAIEVQLKQGEHFQVEQNCPTYLPTGDSCMLLVTYRPTTNGPHADRISLRYDGTAPYLIRLRGSN